MKKIKTTLGERIGDILIERKITQSELCRQTNTSTSSLNALITGQNKNPRIETLIPIAKGLGVSVDYLLGLDEVPTISASNKAINKELHLADSAIENIKRMYYFFDLEIKKLNDHDDYSAKISKEMKEFCISTLNELLSYYDLRDLLLDIYKFLSIKESWCDLEEHYDSDSHSIALTRKQLEKVHLLLINEHFENIKKAKKQ
ncbi:MAG: helix-turn-helix transcriptional regulator [Erysipelotrichaceae bacterium]|nr:helix-turn-helix transcriptional regulator [Erysipelotrichaceae bacterium]